KAAGERGGAAPPAPRHGHRADSLALRASTGPTSSHDAPPDERSASRSAWWPTSGARPTWAPRPRARDTSP
ncbi:MAG: hypothetical protein MZV70_10910, partial [Desulfobacterales bacterium]|nr:hypothetical protein [Desulfobacterales bacterium]